MRISRVGNKGIHDQRNPVMPDLTRIINEKVLHTPALQFTTKWIIDNHILTNQRNDLFILI